jgi:hypothetical protein
MYTAVPSYLWRQQFLPLVQCNCKYLCLHQTSIHLSFSWLLKKSTGSLGAARETQNRKTIQNSLYHISTWLQMQFFLQYIKNTFTACDTQYTVCAGDTQYTVCAGDTHTWWALNSYIANSLVTTNHLLVHVFPRSTLLWRYPDNIAGSLAFICIKYIEPY